ncbi:MAG: type II toxin-antitoxin system RelE/ParE family toxin [Oscillochloris sp.]|nr:type II toxin-antitoxin system RelE/ParE family toxin [Oscillochloris sp.]
MARIVRRPAAVRDLIDLWAYIEAAGSADRADAMIQQIDRVLHTIADHPLIGRQRDELHPGLRSYPVGRYLLFYLPLPDGVDLVRVLYGGRDLLAALGEL